ncbi:uncharacterized protein LOC110428503 isoform X2 [Herrania umbratica]|uniref:Uncharacterized protein LOC110428503 isoform X2 n=1 Tax=Herrania umbratica TaxID=108875 RepID=A0A6J1BLQ4_9ROSI|nr:uncharacterized protein LOC110428503 isoform X2 [Herrania umbratica]
MRPPHFILLCLLTAVLYLLSPYNEFPNLASSPSSIFLTGRRSLRGLKMPLPDHQNRYLKSEVAVDVALQSAATDSMALRYSRSHSNDNMEDLVYYIDYHGVTTHPTPTPKHPKP